MPLHDRTGRVADGHPLRRGRSAAPGLDRFDALDVAAADPCEHHRARRPRLQRRSARDHRGRAPRAAPARRWHRRRPHHVVAAVAAIEQDVGLPVLLAPRLVARRPCHAQNRARRAGAVARSIHRRRGDGFRAGPARPAGRERTPRGDRGARPGRLRRRSSGQDRQRRRGAGATRCLRRGDRTRHRASASVRLARQARDRRAGPR